MSGATYKELVHFGRTPTDGERKIWLEQLGGPEGGRSMFIEAARRRDHKHSNNRRNQDKHKHKDCKKWLDEKSESHHSINSNRERDGHQVSRNSSKAVR